MEVLFRDGMLQFLQGSVHIVIHRADQFPGGVVPVQVDAHIFLAFQVKGHLVFGFQAGHEVVDIFNICVFDTKIINNKGEGDGSGGVEEEAFGVFGFSVTKLCQVLSQVVVGNASRFFESIPCLVDSSVDKTVGGKGAEAVGILDGGGGCEQV